LNEGSLRDVRIKIPEPSVLAPPGDRAVAGGNVETSQRVVDLFLRAAGVRASSQGTMNNLTLGGLHPNGESWSIYETIGGGTGATRAQAGPGGQQVHMTNTRATDVEILETRAPVRVHEFSLRRGSGGPGAQRGGCGLIREIQVLEEAEACLLATRRDLGAPGLHGGGSGSPGLDRIIANGRAQIWDGAPQKLLPGTRIRIETPGGGGFGPPKS
jgi:N-methylhydantoinase B/oxoprolinase/acetone carboxylase alpha subunit